MMTTSEVLCLRP